MDTAQPFATGSGHSGFTGVPSAAATSDAPGLLDNASGVWSDLRGILHDHLQLAALETQRAGNSLITMVTCAIAGALLVATAWLGLVGAGAVCLIAAGLNMALALVFIAALNVAAAFALYLVIRRSSEALRFPATVRSLDGDAAAASSGSAA